MHYYEVYVSSQSYHGNGPLTYQSVNTLAPGMVITVPLRKKPTPAIVVRKTIRPSFKTESVLSVNISEPLPKEMLTLLKWLFSYYPAPQGITTGLLLPPALLKKEITEQNELASPSVINSHISEPPLTEDQKLVVRSIKSASDQQSWLIHGDTGTGKTRVYIELIGDALNNNRSCLVLTPEIGLTSPLERTIKESVKSRVIVLHSGQTSAQRRNSWLEVLYAKEPIVIIGPRSALFVPLKQIGLVIVDESHDAAYKQEQAPHYHALRVASRLAQIHNAKIIFGSATPLITEYYYAKQKEIPILRMRQLASGNHYATQIQVVDQTDRSNFTKSTIISNQIIDAISQCINNGEQSLLFLNRRGTARQVSCGHCGWQALCPKCDLPLTYHSDTHQMQCHTCGYHQAIITSCPICKQTDILYKSAGTKALLGDIQKLFPEAIVARFDTDNSKSDGLDLRYSQIKDGSVQILVGTQMLIKGHDFPKLGMVGVLSADTSLHFPDYTAEEQTFQLLTQVIGRVNRGHRASNVVIQTYNSSAPVLNYALNKNWEQFYSQQIDERKQFNFPPFCFTLKLICRRKTTISAEKSAKQLAQKLRSEYPTTQILGPSPSFVAKSNSWYNWQIIVKSKQRQALTEIINGLPANWRYDIDPINLL